MSTQYLTGLRLPKWTLPDSWPIQNGQPLLATLSIQNGRFCSLTPMNTQDLKSGYAFNAKGKLALPPLLDVHTHLDKTYTRSRIGNIQPGLLAAIEAMNDDQAAHWSETDIHQRAQAALRHAYQYGTRYLRTHIDWNSPKAPTAWHVMARVVRQWQSKMHIEQVALVPLPLMANITDCKRIIQQVAKTHHSVMGGFIHSSNFDRQSLISLIQTTQDYGVDLDLHIDEELSAHAQGFSALLDILDQSPFTGRIVCGHLCALSALPKDKALSLLDRAMKHPITMVSLPTTNLFLQDAQTDRTPHKRGLTLLKEAMSRQIPCLLASDNVQDAFNPIGNYDMLEVLRLGIYSAQLSDIFDSASQLICRDDFLNRAPNFSWVGRKAELLLFATSDCWSWPGNTSHVFITDTSLANPTNGAFHE